ncbi:MAG: hypothetical protein Q7J32_12200 [Sphingomonadaceae bacterium]|nr:hypothetical protein [Sphingomonadaceae bacterium]
MSPNIWMFVRALELDTLPRTQLDTPRRPLDPIADAMAHRHALAPVAFTSVGE